MQELVSPYNHQYIKILGSKSHKVCSVETNFSRAYYTSIGSELWGGGVINTATVFLLKKYAKFKDVSKDLRKNLGIL